MDTDYSCWFLVIPVAVMQYNFSAPVRLYNLNLQFGMPDRCCYATHRYLLYDFKYMKQVQIIDSNIAILIRIFFCFFKMLAIDRVKKLMILNLSQNCKLYKPSKIFKF